MSKPLLDLEGKAIPGFKVNSSKKVKITPFWKDAAWILVVVAVVVFVYWLSTFLLMLSLNWIFNTEMFTFWKTALLSFWLAVRSVSWGKR